MTYLFKHLRRTDFSGRAWQASPEPKRCPALVGRKHFDNTFNRIWLLRIVPPLNSL